MSPSVIACHEGDSLADVEKLMSTHRVSRVVCLDGANQPIGVLSLSDIADLERGGRASSVLKSVSQREARH